MVSAGCSLAYGDELSNRNKRYTKLVSKSLNVPLIDRSLCGWSNEHISQDLINYLSISLNDGLIVPEKTLVVVGWTYKTRLTFFSRNNKYYVVTDHILDPKSRSKKIEQGHYHVFFDGSIDDMIDLKFYYDHHSLPKFLSFNLVKLIHHTQLFLKHNKFNYIFSFADQYDQNVFSFTRQDLETLYITNSTGVERYDKIPYFSGMIEGIDKQCIVSSPFVQFSLDNKYPMGTNHHPLEQAHEAYSHKILDLINKNYLSKEAVDD